MRAVTGAASRFRTAVDGLQANLKAMIDARDDKKRLSELIGQSALLLLELKASSRATHLGVDRYRQLVQDYKKTLDAHHLQLQNLLYRKHHLLREMMLCRDFKIPEVQSVEKNEHISIVGDGGDLASSEQHQTRLKLLTDEMQERQRLEESLQVWSSVILRVCHIVLFESLLMYSVHSHSTTPSLTYSIICHMIILVLAQTAKKKRDDAQQSIETSRTFLAGLPEQVRLVEGSSKQLQAHFATPASVKREEYAMAKNLSEPLYVLFRQLDALCTNDDNANVRIVESEPFQANIDVVLKRGRGGAGTEEEGRGRKRAKGSAVVETVDGSVSSSAGADKFEVDEHAVLLTLRVPVTGHGKVQLTIRFQRLTRINAVTVEAEGLPGRIFSHLFPGDSGKDYPSSEHFHITTDASFPPEARARPFAWAQCLSGLTCLPETQSTRPESSSRMIFQRIHHRIRTHTLLEAQLGTLASKPHPVPVFPSSEALFPPASQLLPKLTSWVENHDPAICQYFFSSSMPGTATASSSMTGGVNVTNTYGCRVFTAEFTGHKCGKPFDT